MTEQDQRVPRRTAKERVFTGLQDLYLDGGTTNRRAHVSLLHALCQEPGPYPRLRSLQLELTGLSEELILPFLENCNNITTFSPLAQSPVPPFALPDTYLPNVQVVSCAHRFVDYLLPGRNIKTLQLLRSGMDVNGNSDPPLLTALTAVGTVCGRTLEELILRSPIADQELSAVFDLVQSTLLRLRELTITLECESSGLPGAVSGFMAFIRLLSMKGLSLPPLLETLTVLVTTPTYRLEFSQIYELVDMRELAGNLVGENLTTFVLQYEGETDICRRDSEGQWVFERRKILLSGLSSQ
uniref:Uncharacterized protein n=1 Tax=Mycena chlorophos TaxID=658473 RepID=A0ABQ0LU52_MYCCL|nr:predicted protein [Mycena chlorophos]